MKAVLSAFVLIWSACLTSLVAHAEENNTLKAKVEQSDSTDAAATKMDHSAGFTDTVCTSGSNTRKIELVTAATETKLPCEVHYKKETEQPGNDQVLWSANSDLSYCHAKAAAFVDKLSGMGWACTSK